ncbi:MAG: hypothetical protein WAK23_12975, partial [Terriglobales bacterium]
LGGLGWVHSTWPILTSRLSSQNNRNSAVHGVHPRFFDCAREVHPGRASWVSRLDHRYETTTDRSITRALDRLERLQSRRKNRS